MFEKGKPKTGGRAKGVPNKNSTNVIDRLNAMDFDVLGEIIMLCKSTQDEKLRGKLLSHLSEFVFPKRKALEISGENPFAEKSLDELKELVKEKLK